MFPPVQNDSFYGAAAHLYNEAAAALPRFKPATLDEVRRRCHAADFDPATRFYAEENGLVVGYATFQMNGRVSFPWCRKGCESLAEPLLQTALSAMKERGMRRAWSASARRRRTSYRSATRPPPKPACPGS